MAWQETVTQTVTGLGFDLVDLERSAGGLLRVTIDLPWQAPPPGEPAGPEQFVTVEDCETVTRQLQYLLEVEGLDYRRLEVGSPGIDRPLTRPGDFARWIEARQERQIAPPPEPAGSLFVERCGICHSVAGISQVPDVLGQGPDLVVSAWLELLKLATLILSVAQVIM